MHYVWFYYPYKLLFVQSEFYSLNKSWSWLSGYTRADRQKASDRSIQDKILRLRIILLMVAGELQYTKHQLSHYAPRHRAQFENKVKTTFKTTQIYEKKLFILEKWVVEIMLRSYFKVNI